MSFSWLPKELPTSWSPTHGWVLSWLLPLITIGVVVLYVLLQWPSIKPRLSERLQKRYERLLLAVLGVASLLAVINYHDYGLFRYGTYLNEWDVYHYYIGTKYARELGYNKMYAATLVADESTGIRYQPKNGVIRKLSTSNYRGVDHVLENREKYKKLFSERRWNEFVDDIDWFKFQLPKDRWSRVLQDKGYNGTPAWSFIVGGLVTSRTSIHSVVSRILILALDPILLIFSLFCVGWAFGIRTTLIMIIFIGTHYLMSWGHMKGALLRLDYVLCVVLGACFVKKGRYKIAGAVLGWAILARAFPLFFVVGPALRFVSIWLEKKRVDKDLLSMLVMCGSTVFVIVIGSIVYFGGIAQWQEWFQKITLHYGDLSHWKIGYQPIADAYWNQGVPELTSVAKDYAEEPSFLLWHRVATWTPRLLVLLPALYFVKNLKDYETILFGFVFMFFMAGAAYYYYFMLCVPLLFFAYELERPSHAIGLIFMLLTGVAGYVLFAGWDPLRDSIVVFRGWKQTFPTYYFMSWLICITALFMVGLAGKRTWRT